MKVTVIVRGRDQERTIIFGNAYRVDVDEDGTLLVWVPKLVSDELAIESYEIFPNDRWSSFFVER